MITTCSWVSHLPPYAHAISIRPMSSRIPFALLLLALKDKERKLQPSNSSVMPTRSASSKGDWHWFSPLKWIASLKWIIHKQIVPLVPCQTCAFSYSFPVHHSWKCFSNQIGRCIVTDYMIWELFPNFLLYVREFHRIRYSTCLWRFAEHFCNLNEW